jgi:hypothetical protein
MRLTVLLEEEDCTAPLEQRLGKPCNGQETHQSGDVVFAMIWREFLSVLCVVVLSALAVPTTLPTVESTIALPPTLDTAADPTKYDRHVKYRIEGYAIVASALGVVLLLSMCLHFFLRFRSMDLSSADWKFEHLTLAQLEEQNMIVELEALFAQQHRIEFDTPFDEQDAMQDLEPSPEPQDRGVVVGTEINTL